MVKKKISFEESLLEANQIIANLEKGDLSLEKSMEEYKKGFELLNDCQNMLQEAEKEFAVLIESVNDVQEATE